MLSELSAREARVVGCLIEKQITTPDQYPLSLNALVNACNQKSNRDPILDLQEREVQEIVDGLLRKHLVIEKSGFGSRVSKYQHVFLNTEFGQTRFTPLEVGILAELLLRGPQTPGELRGRVPRFCPVSGVEEVETALKNLAERAEGPFVIQLAREPGRRDSRYAQLFTGPVATAAATTKAAGSMTADPVEADRLTRLEMLVEELRAEVERLKKQLGG